MASPNHGEEDYIDMEVSYSSNLRHSVSSPREFEFQMVSVCQDRESTTSPADELFYKGKLLPLHLPPRLQMVQSILHGCNEDTQALPPDILPLGWTTDFTCDQPRKSWSNKLKLKHIKQSCLTQKLRASRAYLKSLFTKSACSDEGCARAAGGELKAARRNIATQFDNRGFQISASAMRCIGKEVYEDHRRSFSGAIQRHSASNSLSSSSSSSTSSSSSSSFPSTSQGLKRVSSASSEVEGKIEGAIAYCKRSQHMFSSTKEASEVTLCSLSPNRIAVCADQEGTGFCRI